MLLDREKYYKMLKEEKPTSKTWSKFEMMTRCKQWGDVPDDWPIFWWNKKTEA